MQKKKKNVTMVTEYKWLKATHKLYFNSLHTSMCWQIYYILILDDTYVIPYTIDTNGANR